MKEFEAIYDRLLQLIDNMRTKAGQPELPFEEEGEGAAAEEKKRAK